MNKDSKSENQKDLITRAKKVLIDCLNMTEPEAHEFIIKQSMNLCKSKIEIAEGILNTYEM